MTIEVLSQAEALERAAEAGTKTAVISITSTDQEDVGFPENPDLVAVLRLKFNDLAQECDEEGIPWGRPLPKQQDFAGLKAFVSGLSCDRLIIHCWEGTSRSAAVARAVSEYRGNADRLVTGRRFAPNPLVYRLACRELEII